MLNRQSAWVEAGQLDVATLLAVPTYYAGRRLSVWKRWCQALDDETETVLPAFEG
jgi:hypothetical protein